MALRYNGRNLVHFGRKIFYGSRRASYGRLKSYGRSFAYGNKEITSFGGLTFSAAREKTSDEGTEKTDYGPASQAD